MGCHFLLQGILPTQGSNSGLLHCRQILYHLNYLGSPKVSAAQDNILVSFTSKSFTWGLLLTGGGTPFAAMLGRTGRGKPFLLSEGNRPHYPTLLLILGRELRVTAEVIHLHSLIPYFNSLEKGLQGSWLISQGNVKRQWCQFVLGRAVLHGRSRSGGSNWIHFLPARSWMFQLTDVHPTPNPSTPFTVPRDWTVWFHD